MLFLSLIQKAITFSLSRNKFKLKHFKFSLLFVGWHAHIMKNRRGQLKKKNDKNDKKIFK